MSTTPPLPSELGWERWQVSRLSRRLLPDQVRDEGHTVLRVPEAMRQLFLAMATIFMLYDTVFYRRHRTLSADELDAFRTLHEATQGLIAVLRKEQG